MRMYELGKEEPRRAIFYFHLTVRTLSSLCIYFLTVIIAAQVSFLPSTVRTRLGVVWMKLVEF